MRVIVNGAGIGGLALANGLARQGARVTVLERSAGPEPVGAGIILADNAMRCLAAVGVEVSGRGAALARMDVWAADGTVLQRMPTGAWPGDPPRALHRAELHEALLGALPAGVEVRYGDEAASFEQGEGVRVTTARGDALEADLLVGADGARSRLRAALGGPELVYRGYTCWRSVCADPGVEGAAEIWGRGRRVGLVPIGGGRLYVFLVRNAPERAPGPASFDGFREMFAGFCAPVPAVLDALADAPLLHHDLLDMDEPFWGGGRVWLLGDAAHATTPNQGQGAALAIEDALALTLALRSGEDPTVACAAWARGRHARVRKVVVDSRRFGAVAQWESAAGVWIRDRLARLAPASAGDAAYRALLAPGVELARQAGLG